MNIIPIVIILVLLLWLVFRRPQWRVNRFRHLNADSRYLWVHSGTRWLALTEEDVSKCGIRAEQNEEDAP